MVNDSIKEERKRKNAPFLYAFDYLASFRGCTQKELAESIGTQSPLISDYRSGKKLVGIDMKQRIGIAFHGKLYMPYLDGLSNHMFVKDVPDDEIIANQRDGVLGIGEPVSVVPSQRIDPMAQWQMVIDSQRETIESQKETIASLQQQIATLQREIDRIKSSEFSLVVADKPEPDK